MMNTQKIHELLDGVFLPDIICTNQAFDDKCISNVQKTLNEKLTMIAKKIQPGMRIAITGGSRGIDCYAELVRGVVGFVRNLGAEPFIVPAMGSHGGGTADGQVEILKKLGITEESVHAKIIASMEVVQVGTTSKGLPAYIDKQAFESDGIILLNRIKAHPSFQGDFESGLVKMLAIGLAKHKGAEMTHRLRVEHMAENIVEVAQLSLKHAPILCGIGTVENGYGRLAQIHVLEKEEIILREPGILKEAKRLMARIPLEKIDALIVLKNGKDITGSGTDPNVTGKHTTDQNLSGPKTTMMGILDLSEKAGKNPHGMGLADFMTQRIYEKMDVSDSYVNALTSLVTGPAKMPIVLENDRLVIQACVKASGVLKLDELALVIIEDTKHLEKMYLSKGALKRVLNPLTISTEGDFFKIPFDSQNALHLSF